MINQTDGSSAKPNDQSCHKSDIEGENCDLFNNRKMSTTEPDKTTSN